MAKKKVCKGCKKVYEGTECPVCKSKQTATVSQGRLYVADTEKSFIGKKVGIKEKGEYAIKVR